jgi:hypothetical protein
VEIEMINLLNRKWIDPTILRNKGRDFYEKFSNVDPLPKYGDIDTHELFMFIEGFEEGRKARMIEFGYSKEFTEKAHKVSNHDIGLIVNSFENSKNLLNSIAIIKANDSRKASRIRNAISFGIEQAKMHNNYYDAVLINEETNETDQSMNSIW